MKPAAATNSASGISANLGWSFSDKNRLGLIFTDSQLDNYGSPGYFSANDLDVSTNKIFVPHPPTLPGHREILPTK